MTDSEKQNVLVVAIDGPAASGKSTVARGLAAALNGTYINTGDMYRAVTWKLVEDGIDAASEPDRAADRTERMSVEYRVDADGVVRLYVDEEPVPAEKIRNPEITRRVSVVASIPRIRDYLVERQRHTRRLGRVVLEGRDIGTVVCPETPYKFFITASPKVRAQRRLAQKGETRPEDTVETVAAEIARRDELDSSRDVAPLKPADDAVVINTDNLDAEQTIREVMRCIEKKQSQ